jgi:branched-chain amino acid transport system substrate-binding protein
VLHRRPVALLLPALAVLAFSIAACGDDDGAVETRIVGDTLTVYSSLPLQGPLADVGRDVLRAEKLALKEAGGRSGAYNVSFVSLDSSDPETGRWDPGKVAANARRAVQTPNTIAYLGELEAGASAVSVPILNEGGLLQISPRDTYAGLTERGGRGEPEKYYPSGTRNFARVVPPGSVQAEMLVAAMQRRGVKRLALADDRKLAGQAMADDVAQRAERAGIEVVGRERLATGDEVPDGLGERIVGERPDAFFFSGAYTGFAAGVLRAVHEADRSVLLLGSDELAVAPALPRTAGAAADRLLLTALDPHETADFERRFAAAYGERPEKQAILGYRAMRLALAAIEAAGEDASRRRTVVKRGIEAAGRPLASFAPYRVAGERLVRVRPGM